MPPTNSKISKMKDRVAYKSPSKTQIGHVHLTVSNLNNSLKFYRDILGFQVTQSWGEAIFLSAGGYHHHIALNTWSADVPQKPAEGQIGLYHFAILYPSRKALTNVLKNLVANKYPIGGASDHGVSEAIYLKDPDGNGLELYWDKPKKDWPKDSSGKLKMHTKFLDVNKLIEEAD